MIYHLSVLVIVLAIVTWLTCALVKVVDEWREERRERRAAAAKRETAPAPIELTELAWQELDKEIERRVHKEKGRDQS